MRYHFVINGFSGGWKSQIKKLYGFQIHSLSKMHAGEAMILSRSKEQAEEIAACLAEDAVLISAEDYLAEKVLEPLCRLMNTEDLYIFGHDASGVELAVRTAARKGGSSVVSVHDIEVKERITAKKMVYTNHMEGSFWMKKAPYCISIANGLEQAEFTEAGGRILKEIHCDEDTSFITDRRREETESVKGLEDVRVAVIAGRGAKNKENVEKLEELAGLLGGELLVSRPAAMNAWAPLEKLAGVSGAMIHPEICITAGVSGAAAFYAGIDKSKFIIAVNTDENAPIMKKADVAVADDLIPVVDALKKLLEK